MKRENGWVLQNAVRIMCVAVLSLLFAVFPVTVSQAKEQTEEEKWEAYMESVREEGKAVIRLRLDDEPMAGYGLYYQEDTSKSFYTNKTLDEQVEEGVLKKLPESEEYPGCFLIDSSYKDGDTYYIANGYFYVFAPGETSSANRIAFLWSDDVYLGTDDLATIDYYTVSFEQGDVEVMELPEPFIHKKGKFDDTYSDDFKITYTYPSYLEAGYVEAGGYALSYYADSDGTPVDHGSSTYYLNAPVTLHPVFINEQETKYNNGGNLGDFIYYDWNYDSDKANNEAEPVIVISAEDFVKAVAVRDNKQNFILVRGDIKLTGEACKQICDANDIEYNSYYWEEYGVFRFAGYYTNYSDFVIIEKDASLTLDGISMNCAVNWEMHGTHYTVQDGGSLVLKNKAEMNYADIAVQKQGTITVDGTSLLYCNYLFNHGSITFADNKNYDRANNNANLRRLEVGQPFFNAKSGSITASFGSFKFNLEYSMWTVPSDWSEGNLGEMEYVPFRNNGTMTFTDNCRVVVGDESGSVYQHDRCAQMPFINNGTMTITSISSDNVVYYHNAVFQIERGSFVNNGTLNVTGQNGDYPFKGSDFYANGSNVQIYDGELVNNGTIELKAETGIGMYVNGMYFDPEDCSNTYKSVDTVQWGRINNNKNGVIHITTADETVGLVFGEYTECNNKGKIIFDYKAGAKKNYNMSLAMRSMYYTERTPQFHNEGTVTNNGYIAYQKAESFIWTGNKWSGSGKEGLVLVKAAESSNTSGDKDDTSGSASSGKTDSGNATNSGEKNSAGGSGNSQTVQAEKKGKVIRDSAGNQYVVTLSKGNSSEVAFKCPKGKTSKSITIPKTIKVNSVTYKVTAIAANAFKNQKKLKKVTISAQITKIGKQVFKGCKNLKTITIKSKKLTAKSVSANAFKGIGTKAVIKVPKSKKTAYKKLFRKKGLSKKVKIK